MTDPANQLAAIAPAGPPTDLARFEQRNAEPRARASFDGGIEARESTAYHAHIHLHLTLQRRMIRLRMTAGGVIGGNVLIVTWRVLNAGVHERVLLAADGVSGG